MVLALTTGQKLGIAAVAAVFILFALGAAFVAPRWDRDFPGRRGLPWFVAASVVLFLAMLAAIVVFAREEEEDEGHAEEPPAAETGGVEGDAEAGAEVFASAGCGSCHTLAAAGTSGTIGPDLDASEAGQAQVVEQVTNGGGGMPPFGDSLSEEEIRDVAAFVVEARG